MRKKESFVYKHLRDLEVKKRLDLTENWISSHSGFDGSIAYLHMGICD